MDNLFNDVHGILDAESILEKIFSPTSYKNNMVAAAPVTIDDCRYLSDEVARLISSYTPVQFLEQIPLCLIAAWVFCIKYKDIHPEYARHLVEASTVIPQHHIRFYISMFSAAIVEFSLDNFGIDQNTFDGLSRIMRWHAGFAD